MKKTIMAVILTALMFILTCVPVYADDKQITVTADASTAIPAYTVDVSNSVNLLNQGTSSSSSTSSTWSGTYNVVVNASSTTWPTNKNVLVHPTSSTFVLRGVNDPTVSYRATVYQSGDQWSNKPNTSYMPFGQSATGHISVDIPKTANDVFTGTLVVEYGVRNN